MRESARILTDLFGGVGESEVGVRSWQEYSTVVQKPRLVRVPVLSGRWWKGITLFATVPPTMTRFAALTSLLGVTTAIVMLPIGCGKPAASGAGVVHGEVTFQNRAMAGGLVVFVPNAERGCTGKLHSANISPEGQYQLADGAKAIAPGWYRIALADPSEWYNSEWARAFPTALRRPDLSGLEREVKAGQDHTFDFKIELTAQ